MLITVKEIFDHAKKEGYGTTAPNVQSEDMVRTILEVAEEYHAPMIIDVNMFIHTDLPWFIHMIRGFAGKVPVPVAIDLDHGKSYEDIIFGANSGFTSIMVDRSSLSYEENVEQMEEAVKMCKPLGISVKAELGRVGTGNNYAVDSINNLAVPSEAADFVKETDVDCLAVAIGTAHRCYTGTPRTDFGRLKQPVEARGSTSLVLYDRSGMGDENLRKAVQSGIQKVNLATELTVAEKEELEGLIKDPNFGKRKLIPAFKKGYKDRLAHYVGLFDQAGKAWG